MNNNIKKLLIGRFISAVGDGFFLIALPLYLYKLTNSLLDLGLFFMLIKIPSMILMPKIGVVVENMNKKHGIVISDYLSASFFCVMASLHFLGINNFVVFAIFSAAYLIIASVFSISSSVLFTQLTNETNRLKMNSYKSVLDNLAALGTPAIGAILFAYMGFQGILLINAISFFVSGTLEMFIEYSHDNIAKKTEKPLSIRDYKEVFKWLSVHKHILGLLIIAMILNFFVAPNEEVMFVGILIGKYRIPTSFYGFSSTAFILGSLLASISLIQNQNIKKINLSSLFMINSLGLAIIGLLSIMLFSRANWVVFYSLFIILMFCIGVITTLVNVPLISKFQSGVPVKLQSRFFATCSLGTSFLIPLGIFIAGFFSSRIGADYTLVFYNIIVILLVALIKPEASRTEEL
jgi:MFS family permease